MFFFGPNLDDLICMNLSCFMELWALKRKWHFKSSSKTDLTSVHNWKIMLWCQGRLIIRVVCVLDCQLKDWRFESLLVHDTFQIPNVLKIYLVPFENPSKLLRATALDDSIKGNVHLCLSMDKMVWCQHKYCITGLYQSIHNNRPLGRALLSPTYLFLRY